MASYLDEIPKFREYVPQLPLETIAQVGMYKQEKYEKNVTAIQEQIEKIAGLDVYRPQDKAMLQSKLDELGGKLRTFAAGDFSNFQLANSVSGMTKQIAKDPVIQSAVASTATYRKEVEKMKKIDDEGKGNPANTLRFNKGVDKWYNDPTPGASFGTQYKTPIDVWAKIKDIAKEVGIDEMDVQQLYQTDDKGNVLYETDKHGNKTAKWNPVMAEKILKGKDAGKILKAFQTALTPADFEQLAINGEYEKASATPEMLKKEIIENSDEQINFTKEKINNIKVALLTENQKNTKDPNKIKSLEDQLEYFQNSLTSLETSRDNSVNAVDKNPDAVRASLYTNNYLFTMANKLSSHDESTKYSVSPLWTITMDQNRFNRDIQRDKIADYHWSKEQERKDREDQYTKEKDSLEFFLKYGYGTPPPGYTGLGDAVKLPIPTDGESAIKNGVEDDFSKSVSDLNNLNYKLTLQYFKEANKKGANETDAQYEERMRKAIYSFAKNNKESVDPASGEINSYTARFATKQLTEWNKNPNNIPAEFRGLIASQKTLLKTTSNLQQKINEVKTEAVKKAKELGINVPTPDEIKKNVKATSLNINGVGTVNLSQQDVMDLAASTPSAFNVVFNTKEEEQESKRAGERLRLKYGDVLFNKIYNEVFTLGMEGGIMVGNNEVYKAGEFRKSSNYKKLAKIESQLYIDRGVVKQPISQAIIRGKDNKEDVNQRISTVIDKYTDGLNETPDFTREDMQQALLSNDNRAARIKSYPGLTESSPTRHVLSVTNPKNGKTAEVTIDEGDYKYIMKVAPPKNMGIPETIDILNGKNTTNLSGTSNPSTAWFSADDFKNLEKNAGYTLTADLINDASNSNLAWMKIYIHRPDGSTEPITYPDPFSKTNEDGSYNTKLDYLPLGINNTVIKQIKRK